MIGGVEWVKVGAGGGEALGVETKVEVEWGGGEEGEGGVGNLGFETLNCQVAHI